MNATGKIIGIATYSYTPEGSTKHYEGYRLCIARDAEPSDSRFGVFTDTVSLSFRDMGSYTPSLDDEVRYNTYRDGYGKVRCGFVIPM